jgi:serine/threonine protein kinase
MAPRTFTERATSSKLSPLRIRESLSSVGKKFSSILSPSAVSTPVDSAFAQTPSGSYATLTPISKNTAHSFAYPSPPTTQSTVAHVQISGVPMTPLSPTSLPTPNTAASNVKLGALDLTGLPDNDKLSRTAVFHALTKCSKLDAFHVSRVLGFGSNGTVLCATSATNAATQVAIKIIYKSQAEIRNPRQDKSKVPHEIAVLRAISQQAPHRHVIRLHEDWEDEFYYYMITDLSGYDWLDHPTVRAHEPATSFSFYNSRLGRFETLTTAAGSSDLWAWSVCQSLNRRARRISPNIPNPHIIRPMFYQIATAVHHLHSVRIFHGDLKEENVLVSVDSLTNTLKAQICDFGHARWISSSASSTSLSRYGTTIMTPPELYQNLHDKSSRKISVDGFKADVFALGLLLFTMLHGPGQLPEAIQKTIHSNEWSFKTLVENGGVYPLFDMHASVASDHVLVDLLRRMLAVDPEKRLSMSEVMAHPWLQRSI